VKPIKPTRWATVAEIRAARRRWPYSVPDAVHVAAIRHQTGLSGHAAAECLAILRGDSEGDVVELDAAMHMLRPTATD
jgi:hypothetical protein